MIVSTSKPRMPLELSLNAITLLDGFARSVDLIMSSSVSGAGSPSMISLPLKNQCRECSLLDCAS